METCCLCNFMSKARLVFLLYVQSTILGSSLQEKKQSQVCYNLSSSPIHKKIPVWHFHRCFSCSFLPPHTDGTDFPFTLLYSIHFSWLSLSTDKTIILQDLWKESSSISAQYNFIYQLLETSSMSLRSMQLSWYNIWNLWLLVVVLKSTFCHSAVTVLHIWKNSSDFTYPGLEGTFPIFIHIPLGQLLHKAVIINRSC